MATNQQQPLDEFEFLRRRATQASQTQQKQAGQDLKRQFASMGNLQSGAAIKQQQLAKMRGEQALGQELGQIDVAQAQERRRIAEQQQAMDFQSQEAQKQRQFQTGERLGSQQFGTQERIGSQGFQKDILGQQQQFQTGERLGTQQFMNLTNEANRKFQTGERIGAQEHAMLLQGNAINATADENEKNRLLQTQMQNTQNAFIASESKLGRSFSIREREAAQKFTGLMATRNFAQARSEREAAQIFNKSLADAGIQANSKEAEAAREMQKNLTIMQMKQEARDQAVNAVVAATNTGLDPQEILRVWSDTGIDVNPDGTLKITPVDQKITPPKEEEDWLDKGGSFLKDLFTTKPSVNNDSLFG